MADVTKVIGVGVDPSGAQKGARVVKSELQGIGRSADKAEKEMKQMGRGGAASLKQVGASAKATQASVTGLTTSVKTLAVTFISVAAAARIVSSSINQSLDFSRAIGEVGTLGADMEGTAAKAREFAQAFGTDATLQVKAFYQTFSAGASTLAEATRTLDVANKLAIGGATDVETAVDGLTSVLNAYGDAVRDATDVSDSMFVAMKAGKTTIGELASALGRVTPLAAALGVSFDEVTAAVAALTKGGVTTKMAVTQLQAILTNIVKPTSEAAKQSKVLGIEFSAAALQAQGLQGFLEGVIEATGGSTAVLAQMFGSVEALGAVLAFAGQAGEDFNAILKEMENKAGATSKAYLTMAERFDNRWNVAVAKATDLGLTLGNALLTVLVPALTALAANADVAAAAMAGLAVFWAASKIAGMAAFSTSATAIATAFRIVGPAAVAAAAGMSLLSAAMAAISWPLVAAVAVTTAIVVLGRSFDASAKAADAYKDAQERVNSALDGTANKADTAAAAIRSKAAADVDAARTVLRLDEADLARRRIQGAIQRKVVPDFSDAEAQIAVAHENLDSLNRTLQGAAISAANTAGNIGEAFALATDAGATTAEGLTKLANIDLGGVVANTKSVSSALNDVGPAAKSTMAGIQDVGKVTAEVLINTVRELTALSGELRSLETQLSSMKSQLASLANVPLKEIFGPVAKAEMTTFQSAADNFRKSVAGIFEEMRAGKGTPEKMAASLESAREALIAFGGDSNLINRFADAVIKSQFEVQRLTGDVTALSAAINNIQDKTVHINIETRRYDVPGGPVTVSSASTTTSVPFADQPATPFGETPVAATAGLISAPVDTTFDDLPDTFAHGGISHGPAIFGEAGPEAAVPLPDGRSIPVTLTGPVASPAGEQQPISTETAAPASTIQSTVSESATLKEIEINTAQTAAFTERALGFLDTIDADIVAAISEMQRTRIASTVSPERSEGDAFLIRSQALLNLATASKLAVDANVFANLNEINSRFRGFHEGGVIPASGSGNVDTRVVEILTRPDETIAIQTPKQRKDMVNKFDAEFERGRSSGRGINFNGPINIHIPSNSRDDRRSARALADEFTRQVQSNLSPLYKD